MEEAKVLIVEDEIFVARDLQLTLEQLGYMVTSLVPSGEEAIKKAKEENPDIVLMDIILQGEMDGIEAAEKIYSSFDIPVIYLTAHSEEKTLERSKSSEPFGYMIKPFGEKEIHIAIEMALYKYKTEKKLKESEEWLSTTLRSIGDAVIATDKKGHVMFMNPVAEILTGWEQKDASGKSHNQLFHLISEETCRQVKDPVEKAIRKDTTVDLVNHTLKAKDGKETPVDYRSAPIRDDKGNIAGVVVVFRDVTKRKKEKKKLERLATTDVLTKAYNRTKSEEILGREMERVKRYNHPLSMAIFDIDHFKKVNDTHGHIVGDNVLKCVATIVKENIRKIDHLIRWGGEEFVIVDPETDLRRAEALAERIRKVIENYPFDRAGKVTVSFGVTQFKEDDTEDTFIKRADDALYKAKKNGRNRVEVSI